LKFFKPLTLNKYIFSFSFIEPFNLMHMRCKVSLSFVMAILLGFPAFAQEKKMAVISGVIKDARSKSPLNEAVVTLSSSAFQGQKFALTDSTGMYRVRNLPGGNYTIAFEMEGYEKFVQENIALQPGMSLGVSFEMVKARKAQDKKIKQESEKVIAIRKEEN
jgi:hypothetical protein